MRPRSTTPLRPLDLQRHSGVRERHHSHRRVWQPDGHSIAGRVPHQRRLRRGQRGGGRDADVQLAATKPAAAASNSASAAAAAAVAASEPTSAQPAAAQPAAQPAATQSAAASSSAHFGVLQLQPVGRERLVHLHVQLRGVRWDGCHLGLDCLRRRWW